MSKLYQSIYGGGDEFSAANVASDISVAVAGRQEQISVACTAIDGDVAASTTYASWTPRYPIRLMSVAGRVQTAPTGQAMIVDIHADGTTIMASDKISIDAGETDSADAGTQPTLSTVYIPAGTELLFIADQVGSGTAGAGLVVDVVYTQYMNGIVVQDTFTDTNGTALTAHTPDIHPVGASSWVLSGFEDNTESVEIQGNELVGDGNEYEQLLYIDAGLTDNYSVEADCFEDYSNLVWRVGDDGDEFFVAYVEAPDVELWKHDGDWSDVLATGGLPADITSEYVNIRVVVNGNTFTCYANDELIWTYESSDLAANTGVGIQPYGDALKYDNFVVRDTS